MHDMLTRTFVVSMVAVIALAPGVQAAPSSPPPQDSQSQSSAAQSGEAQKPYDRGMELVQSEDYKGARAVFEQLAVEQPKNAEVLNMLAYTQRKTGDIDEAISNYHQALKLKPKFPQAREYLAEAYIQAALREADTLKGYGGDGKEELRKLSDAFHEAASTLSDTGGKSGKSGGGW